MKSGRAARIEWRLYRRMMNSPDEWQRIYREAVNGETAGQREPTPDSAPLSHIA